MEWGEDGDGIGWRWGRTNDRARNGAEDAAVDRAADEAEDWTKDGAGSRAAAGDKTKYRAENRMVVGLDMGPIMG